MMKTLILADQHQGDLSSHLGQMIAAAQGFNAPIDVLIYGNGADRAAQMAATYEGIEQIRVLQCEDVQPEIIAAYLASVKNEYQNFCAAATSAGKDVLPRLAAVLDVMQVSEVIKFHSPTCYDRPIYAGNAIETLETSDAFRVMTIRTSNFSSVGNSSEAKPISVEQFSYQFSRSQHLNRQDVKAERPALAAARVVVSGGRALGSAEAFTTIIEPLADVLGAAIGASRAAVDAGYVPNDCQVGQTGKIVAPELYIAVGISGAIQHVAGMKGSKTIVAINKDPNAPIFQIADYGLVRDLFTCVPELTEKLRKHTV